MIVFVKTLRDQRRALIGWGLGMAMLVVLYASFYPSIKENAAQLNQYMESLPEALRNMIGGAGAITSPTGYLQSEIFSIMGPLLLMILAIGAGARAIAGEEEARSLDLLLVNPIARRRVVVEKFWAMVVATVGVGVVMWVAIVLVGPPFGLRVGLVNLAAAVVGAVLVAIGFGTWALALGCWLGRRGLAIAIVTSAAVVTYLLHVLAPSVDAVRSLRLISPFYYYIGGDPLRTGLDPANVIVLVGIAAVGLAIALFAFDRRDLAA